MKNITLSVIIPTYNQQDYIQKALDSAISQTTNFDYEILIGNDASSDKTQEICQNFHKKYTKKVRLINRKKNIGLIKNYLDLINQTKGRYIAILEGDDYWIDSFKLQKQYDFIKNKNNIGLVFTNCYLYNEHTKEKYLKYNQPPEYNSVNAYYDLLNGNFITAITICFDKELILENLKKDYNFLLNLKTIDYYIILCIANKSEIGYLPDITSLYRVHEKSESNSSSIQKRYEFLKSSFEIKYHFSKSLNNTNIYFLKKQFCEYLFSISLKHGEIDYELHPQNFKGFSFLFYKIYFKSKILRYVSRKIYLFYINFKKDNKKNICKIT